MTNNLLQIKIKERLNKLASLDYDNIECWQVIEAFNKAQLEWVRRQVHGANQFKEGDEGSKMNIDDIQILITPTPLTATKASVYYETAPIPGNYLYYKRVSANIVSACCPNPRPMVIYLAENADVDKLLIDDFKQPSAEWGETFCTMLSNKIRIDTNGEFEIADIILTYFRKPVEIAFLGCVNPATGVVSITNTECEFKDDIVELIVDETCAILAGDIESIVQYQRTKQNSTNNT